MGHYKDITDGSCSLSVGTASGVLLGKLRAYYPEENKSLIGSAGVSAVPSKRNIPGSRPGKTGIYPYACHGANVAGVIGSAIVAGMLLSCMVVKFIQLLGKVY